VKLAHKSLYNWPTYLKLSVKPSKERLGLRTDSSRLLEVETGNISGTFCYEAGKRFNDLPINIKKERNYVIFYTNARKFYVDCATARILDQEV